MMSDAGLSADGVDMSQFSEDAFLGGRVRALQPKRGYRAGIDAVLLAAACPAAPGRRQLVLDAGAGAGVVGLCVAARLPGARITMVEIAGELAAVARANAEANGWESRIDVIEGDVTGPMKHLEAGGLRRESFDHVLANPPFHIEGSGTSARDALKAGAHAMAEDGLERWAKFLAAAARPGGTMTIIHRAEQLAALLVAVDGRFGALHVLPVYPRHDAPAHRVIVRGVKGSRAPLRLAPGLVLHGPGNEFLPEAEAILRKGQALLAG